MIPARVDVPLETAPMTYARLYGTDDGGTRFDDVAVSMTATAYVPGIPFVDVAEPEAVTALTFSRLKAGYASDWHPAPRRQFVFIASAILEVLATSGERRPFGPGAVLFVEDVDSIGHKTRTLGPGECVFITVAG